MSQLNVYTEDQPTPPIVETTDFEHIAAELGPAGIRFERWSAARGLPADADNDAIVAAYRPEIDRLIAARGYQTFDVVSMQPDHPEKDAIHC